MSRVAIHEDSNQMRVFNPRVKKLPPNPHIGHGTEAFQRALAPPSETSDSERLFEPRGDKWLRHRLLACDQRSFLTGSASADLRAAYIIAPVRSNPTRKREVQDLLRRQRIHDYRTASTFLLDGPTNAILLEASLHVHWDLYGTFCIVPSENDSIAMLDALHAINAKWARYGEYISMFGYGSARPLNISQPPFVKPHWDIVILHPSAFLPDRQPLFIARERTFYVKDQPPPTSQLSWASYIAYDDCLRSETPPHTPIPPFVVENVREAMYHPPLASIAMVINAHYKLDQFMREHGESASPRVRWFADQMSQLVTALFYLPPGYAPVLRETQSSQRLHSTTATTASPSAEDTGQHTDQVGLRSGDPGSGTRTHSSVSHDENILATVDPPEAVGDDGLTDSEFQLVSAKARDPLLDPKERADAAMMMMFGTRRLADPYV